MKSVRYTAGQGTRGGAREGVGPRRGGATRLFRPTFLPQLCLLLLPLDVAFCPATGVAPALPVGRRTACSASAAGHASRQAVARLTASLRGAVHLSRVRSGWALGRRSAPAPAFHAPRTSETFARAARFLELPGLPARLQSLGLGGGRGERVVRSGTAFALCRHGRSVDQ